MIAVVKNTGGTNLNSVCHALDRLGARFVVTGDPETIKQADKVILPGVGAAAHAMRRLLNTDLVPVLTGLEQPVLGICLGMQLLFRNSEEGDVSCIGVIDGSVKALPNSPDLRVPHMGWNLLTDIDESCPLLRGLPTDPYVYFVHSFAGEIGPWTKARSTHGQAFTAVVQQGNFFGCQFHPEKSAATGAKILANFVEMED